MMLALAVQLDPATAAKVLAVAGGVYAVLQLVKKLVPALGGWWALALNIALSILGTLVVVPAEQFFSLQTLLTVITAAAAAAGVHGTVKNLSQP